MTSAELRDKCLLMLMKAPEQQRQISDLAEVRNPGGFICRNCHAQDECAEALTHQGPNTVLGKSYFT